MINKITRQLPQTFGEWAVAIFLLTAASVSLTLLIAFFKLVWGFILS